MVDIKEELGGNRSFPDEKCKAHANYNEAWAFYKKDMASGKSMLLHSPQIETAFQYQIGKLAVQAVALLKFYDLLLSNPNILQKAAYEAAASTVSCSVHWWSIQIT